MDPPSGSTPRRRRCRVPHATSATWSRAVSSLVVCVPACLPCHCDLAHLAAAHPACGCGHQARELGKAQWGWAWAARRCGAACSESVWARFATNLFVQRLTHAGATARLQLLPATSARPAGVEEQTPAPTRVVGARRHTVGTDTWYLSAVHGKPMVDRVARAVATCLDTGNVGLLLPLTPDCPAVDAVVLDKVGPRVTAWLLLRSTPTGHYDSGTSAASSVASTALVQALRRNGVLFRGVILVAWHPELTIASTRQGVPECIGDVQQYVWCPLDGCVVPHTFLRYARYTAVEDFLELSECCF